MPSTDSILLTLEDWHLGGHTFNHNGYNVFYRAGGIDSSEALVCLHGFPTSSWDWNRLWPYLCAHWRVMAFDMIGYGFSDKPHRYDYSIGDQADLCEELLNALHVTRVHIIAHDVGDSVAQELLARHTERADTGDQRFTIQSVCLLNGGLFPETHRPTLIQKILASRLGFVAAKFMSERRFRTSFAAIFGADTKPSDAELHEFWSLIAFNHGERIAHKLIGYMNERRLHRERWVGALHSNVPLLIVNGSDDPVSGAHMVTRLRDEVPGIRVVTLPGIGHYPQIENAGAVLRAYVEFREHLMR
jgi:pimeloyl-ACP methyl ester carboxylesterase